MNFRETMVSQVCRSQKKPSFDKAEPPDGPYEKVERKREFL